MPNIQMPKGHEGNILSYVLSFSNTFTSYQQLKGCLDSVAENIDQSKCLMERPLGLFACITAEEEAATFFFLCLKKRGYALPRYDKLTSHQDKVRMVIWGIVFEKYYFNIFESFLQDSCIRLSLKGRRVRITLHGNLHERYSVEIPNVLQSVHADGKSKDKGDIDVERPVIARMLAAALQENFGEENETIRIINQLARRRNKCLYGDPRKKMLLKNEDLLIHYENNCAALIIMGYLVFQDDEKWPSVQVICEELGKLLAFEKRTV